MPDVVEMQLLTLFRKMSKPRQELLIRAAISFAKNTEAGVRFMTGGEDAGDISETRLPTVQTG